MRSMDGADLAWRRVNAIRDGVNLAWRRVHGLGVRMNFAWTAFIHVPALHESRMTARIAFGACMNFDQKAVSPFAGQVMALHARR
jgi:hypothetical protein